MRATVRRALASIVLAASLATSGCASVYGTVTQPSPFVGVQLSCWFLMEHERWTSGDVAIGVLDVLDLPPSAVLDTLFLPFTVAFRVCYR